jgi:hypothetical protein
MRVLDSPVGIDRGGRVGGGGWEQAPECPGQQSSLRQSPTLQLVTIGGEIQRHQTRTEIVRGRSDRVQLIVRQVQRFQHRNKAKCVLIDEIDCIVREYECLQLEQSKCVPLHRLHVTIMDVEMLE